MKTCAWILSAAVLLFAGCASEQFMTDAKHPEVALTLDGGVTYRGRFVDPEDLPGLLRNSGFKKDETVFISCPEGLNDWRFQRRVMLILSRGGYPRHMLVGERRASATLGRTSEERRRETREQLLQQRRQGKPVKIRYKN